MNYCKNCILPNTRPNIILLADGVCSACHSHKNKKEIDWQKRGDDFTKIIKKIKNKNLPYDCLIPVSGGKDSTWQVIKALEYKLNPLTFTYKPILRTKIGQQNIENLKRLGVHHIEFSINENVERKFLKKTFLKFGSVAIPMHMAIWNISYDLAKKFNIPYIIYGENSAVEYGGKKNDIKLKNLDSKWIKKFGVNFGTTAKDWLDEDLNYKDLAPFFKNKKKIPGTNNPTSIFLGDYFRWDPLKIYTIAKKNGFKSMSKGAKTGIYKYADIDDHLISIHHFLKIYKFGFSRTFDNLSLEIRNKRISRSKAVNIVKKENFKIPHDDIYKFCKLININKKKFFSICESFRNKNIWKKNKKKWKLIKPLI
jgi:N-acetyl sugar amidotransferase